MRPKNVPYYKGSLFEMFKKLRKEKDLCVSWKVEDRLKNEFLTSLFLRDCLVALRARGFTLILSLAMSVFSSSVCAILSKSKELASTPATLQQIHFKHDTSWENSRYYLNEIDLRVCVCVRVCMCACMHVCVHVQEHVHKLQEKIFQCFNSEMPVWMMNIFLQHTHTHTHTHTQINLI